MTKLDYEIDDFMCYCESKKLSKKTMRSYEQTLKLFAKYLEEKGIQSTKEVSREAVRNYIVYLRERGKYTITSNDNSREWNNPQNRKDYSKQITNTTINNYIRNLKVYFNFMKDNYLMKDMPLDKVKFLKAERNRKVFIKDNEFYKLLKSIDTTKYAEYRDYIIIQLIFDTGMRIGETLSIDITTDLDLVNRAIYLKADKTKGKSARTVFFSIKMAEELRRWIRYKDRYVESNLLFPVQLRDKELAVNNFEKNYKKYCDRAGIKECSPHGLRNNFAKRYLMAGGDIYTLSRILGHSSVTVTEKCYLDLEDEDIKKNYQRYSPLANLRRV
ncbi:MAG: tyrosine-type recombinase/integrase [Clostridia bacterium]|nr:tyrosine-type recombinase/integrase [Clostridia bacterium]